MNAELAAKIEQLRQAKVAGYRAIGHMNPELSGAYAIADILNMYKGQERDWMQLLSEEIEDAHRAACGEMAP